MQWHLERCLFCNALQRAAGSYSLCDLVGSLASRNSAGLDVRWSLLAVFLVVCFASCCSSSFCARSTKLAHPRVTLDLVVTRSKQTITWKGNCAIHNWNNLRFCLRVRQQALRYDSCRDLFTYLGSFFECFWANQSRSELKTACYQGIQKRNKGPWLKLAESATQMSWNGPTSENCKRTYNISIFFLCQTWQVAVKQCFAAGEGWVFDVACQLYPRNNPQ